MLKFMKVSSENAITIFHSLTYKYENKFSSIKEWHNYAFEEQKTLSFEDASKTSP